MAKKVTVKKLTLAQAKAQAQTRAEAKRLLDDQDITLNTYKKLVAEMPAGIEDFQHETKAQAKARQHQAETESQAVKYVPFLIQRALIGLANNDAPQGAAAEFARDWSRIIVNEDPNDLFELVFGTVAELEHAKQVLAVCSHLNKALAREYIAARRIQNQRDEERAKEYRAAGGYNHSQSDPMDNRGELEAEPYAAAPEMGEEGYVPTVEIVEASIQVLYIELNAIYLNAEKIAYAFDPTRRRGFLPFGFKITGPQYAPAFYPLLTLEDAFQEAERKRLMALEEEVNARAASIRKTKDVLARFKAKQQAAYNNVA
ncbi:hypothetical protein [Parendozoicomonas haliclonae]|uniref:Uncharacterized protein n=1 Tax=Parendozoicomonas haliclonae TaxID=1960125 RepID=A0A1X7AE54_9GAMM|nr:hypothetical protein [Parendozoicomonas haliclonae]SMA33419.1 hypothetical protein EHSB41UT_00276 [Parendozoicomonas haliclonae]